MDWIKKPKTWIETHEISPTVMGENLRRRRIYKDLTIKGLSQLSGVDWHTIDSYERNGLYGSVSVWIALSDALGKDGLDWLFERHED